MKTAVITVLLIGLLGGWAMVPNYRPRGIIPTHRTDRILAGIEQDGFTLTNDTKDGYYGYVSTNDPKHIHVDLTLPPDHRDEILLHEWAHALLGHAYGETTNADAEVEARTVALAVTRAVDIGSQEQDITQWFRIVEYKEHGAAPLSPERETRLNTIARHMADAINNQ